MKVLLETKTGLKGFINIKDAVPIVDVIDEPFVNFTDSNTNEFEKTIKINYRKYRFKGKIRDNFTFEEYFLYEEV